MQACMLSLPERYLQDVAAIRERLQGINFLSAALAE